ncbi:MAG: SDR family oxidoreductase [bacterium]
MESLLITGGSGFLGGNLAAMAFPCWETYATYCHSPMSYGRFKGIYPLDITDKEAVKKIIFTISPRVIIHTAALSKFDACAENRTIAWEVNVEGTRNIALAARQTNSRMIYISTDLVFGGDRGYYAEHDIPDPICYYGATKLAGEQAISSLCSNYCIVRTALIYGRSANSSRCFTETMIDHLQKGKMLRLFVDEYRSPIYSTNLCALLLELAARDELQGIYHLCGPERVGRFDFGIKLAEVFGFDAQYIVGTSVHNGTFKDKRPKDCSMHNKKASRFLQTKCMDIKDGLLHMKISSRRLRPDE